jgi:hypothetical protein
MGTPPLDRSINTRHLCCSHSMRTPVCFLTLEAILKHARQHVGMHISTSDRRTYALELPYVQNKYRMLADAIIQLRMR